MIGAALADVRWPGPTLKRGPGLFFCRVGKKVYVKNAWSNAARRGVKQGDEVVKIDGMNADAWLAARVAELSQFASFSTDQQAEFFACHWGLGGTEGSSIQLRVKSPGKSARKVRVSRGRASPAACERVS